jgi:hypothetical protein
MKNDKKRWLYYGLLLLSFFGVLDTILLVAFVGVNTGTIVPGLAGGLVLAYAYYKSFIRKAEPVIRSVA